MEDKQRQHLEELRQIKMRRLRELERQAALYGPAAAPHIRIEIEDLQTEIQQIEAELKQLAAVTQSPISSRRSKTSLSLPNSKINTLEIIGLIIAFFSLLAAIIVIPEVRRFVGLDQPTPHTIDEISSPGKTSAPPSSIYTPVATKNQPTVIGASGWIIKASPIPISSSDIPSYTTSPINPDDLRNKSSEQLAFMRNAIFAANGCYFAKDELRQQFLSKSWYHPVKDDYNRCEYKSLNAVQQRNTDLILEYEQKSHN
jgi:hypothetical protein